MSSATYSTITNTKGTDVWVDITVALPAIKSIACTLYNTGNQTLYLFFGGVAAPVSITDGIHLHPSENIAVNAANIWLRGSGKLTPSV